MLRITAEAKQQEQQRQPTLYLKRHTPNKPYTLNPKSAQIEANAAHLVAQCPSPKTSRPYLLLDNTMTATLLETTGRISKVEPPICDPKIQKAFYRSSRGSGASKPFRQISKPQAPKHTPQRHTPKPQTLAPKPKALNLML